MDRAMPSRPVAHRAVGYTELVAECDSYRRSSWQTEGLLQCSLGLRLKRQLPELVASSPALTGSECVTWTDRISAWIEALVICS